MPLLTEVGSMTDHPITPPPELVQQWIEQGVSRPPSADYMTCFATLAARWGADQELEACCEWVEKTLPSWAPHTLNEQLRIARRPKPPSLKEQALIELGAVYNRDKIDDVTYDTIRLALEQLDD